MIETTYYTNSPVSVALLPDLHGHSGDLILESLRYHRPDFITIAGDLFYGSYPENDCSPLETQQEVLPFLEGCTAIASTFFSLGNHEWMLDKEDLDRIRETGTTILDNEWTEWNGIAVGGLTSGHVTEHRSFLNSLTPEERSHCRYPKRVLLSGVSRFTDFRRLPEPVPETAWLTDFASVSRYHILLCHHPEYIGLIPDSIELILSGHAHGGQWRLAGHGVFAPGQGWWPKLTSGIHDGRLVISRGLSNTSSIPRLWNPPEIVYIEKL